MLRYFLFFFSVILFVSEAYSNIFNKTGYYVVVGAFASKNNADRYAKSLQRKGFDCELRYVAFRRLHYVCHSFNQDLSVARTEVLALRLSPEFEDAWIFYLDAEEGKSEDQFNLAESKMELIKNDSPNLIDFIQVDEIIPTNKAELPGTIAITKSVDVFLSIYNATNDKVVAGTISVIDVDKSKLVSKIDGNTYTVLPNPKSKSNKLLLVCDALGYRKVQHEIIYPSILTDSTAEFVEDVGTALMIKFELIKYTRGDIRALYDVYFYNDANIMIPESRYELDRLYKMMIDNPNYRIKLHGHTNGSHFGKIVLRNSDEDFFTISKSSNQNLGSAKKLSAMRAETIRQYLIKQGIDAARMEIKGWGGSRQIYDKNSLNARKNVRVEVEVISE